MKRLIYSTTSQYGIDEFTTIAEYADDTYCNNDIAQAVLDADDSGILETFAFEIDTEGEYEWVGSKIKLVSDWGYVRAELKLKPLRKGQVIDRSSSVGMNPNQKLTPKQIARKLAADTRKILTTYYERYQESLAKQALKDKYNSADTKMISAFAVAQRYVKKYAGLTATFAYSDSGTAQYMLWDLPGVEKENAVLDEAKLEEYEIAFNDALIKFEDDTEVVVDYINTPHGGNYIRACFEFKVNPKIQLVYNKKDDTYTRI